MRGSGCLLARLAAVTVAALAIAGFLLPVPAHAAVLTDRGASVMAMAKTRTGDWYADGGAGPTTFDCSGLVYWAAHQLGINMPRDTWSMLATGVADGILVRTYHPVAGDLAFYGDDHVEFVDRGHDVTFGTRTEGTRVGDYAWNVYWKPTMYFQVR